MSNESINQSIEGQPDSGGRRRRRKRKAYKLEARRFFFQGRAGEGRVGGGTSIMRGRAGEGRGGGRTFIFLFPMEDLLCHSFYISLVHTARGCRLTDFPLNPHGVPWASSWSASGLTYE